MGIILCQVLYSSRFDIFCRMIRILRKRIRSKLFIHMISLFTLMYLSANRNVAFMSSVIKNCTQTNLSRKKINNHVYNNSLSLCPRVPYQGDVPAGGGRGHVQRGLLHTTGAVESARERAHRARHDQKLVDLTVGERVLGRPHERLGAARVARVLLACKTRAIINNPVI